MKINYLKFTALALAGFFLSGAERGALAQSGPFQMLSDRERTIVVGKITDNPRKHHERIHKFANELASRLADFGIFNGDVFIARNFADMVAAFKKGQVDLLSETAFSAIELNESAGAEFFLHEWKLGIAFYKTLFFSRADSGINSLADLVGKKIAFEDPGSTSGFLIPNSILKRSGIRTIMLESPQDDSAKDSVGYVFSRGELNMISWVARGVVSAGAFSDRDCIEIESSPEHIRNMLKVFHSSRPIVRSIMMARKDIRSDVKTALRAVMTNLHGDKPGRQALKTYYKVLKYSPFGNEARESLDETRTLIR